MAEETVKAIVRYMGLLGTPKKIVTGNGREFNNKALVTTMYKLLVQTHFTTVGNSRSQGVIEMLHSMLMERINLFRKDQGLDASKAINRAILATTRLIWSRDTPRSKSFLESAKAS